MNKIGQLKILLFATTLLVTYLVASHAQDGKSVWGVKDRRINDVKKRANFRLLTIKGASLKRAQIAWVQPQEINTPDGITKLKYRKVACLWFDVEGCKTLVPVLQGWANDTGTSSVSLFHAMGLGYFFDNLRMHTTFAGGIHGLTGYVIVISGGNKNAQQIANRCKANIMFLAD